MKNEAIGHINNPKIRFSDIRKFGIKHYENRDLVKKYIDGNTRKGTTVFKDILDFDKTHIFIKGGKIEADTQGV